MSNEVEDFDIDAALESGDPELIDKALAAAAEGDIYAEQDEAEADNDGFSFGEKGAKPDAKNDDAGDGESDGDTSGHDEDDNAPKVVKSKDGKHEIPYSVLEYERQQRKQLEQQLMEMQQEREQLQANYQQTESALNNVKAKLEKEGLDVEEMFANPDDITDKQWAEIEEDYGVLGKMMKKLITQQQSNVQQIQQAEAEAGSDFNPELQQALNANPELLQWRDGDVNRWTEALRLDNELRKTPEWQGRLTAERFAHVVQQTKKAFGDPLKRAKEIIDKTEQAAPDSLSDLGQAPVRVKNDIEALKDMTPAQLEDAMAKMTPSQLDELFAQGF
ncbi:hypothetical protein GJQ54_05305 [Oceanospirillaceae bacterium ASx5O]|nr:hypothetical protein GJQ54_05305 [Oceanospirillaceae bacterium ASx5O]